MDTSNCFRVFGADRTTLATIEDIRRSLIGRERTGYDWQTEFHSSLSPLTEPVTFRGIIRSVGVPWNGCNSPGGIFMFGRLAHFTYSLRPSCKWASHPTA